MRIREQAGQSFFDRRQAKQMMGWLTTATSRLLFGLVLLSLAACGGFGSGDSLGDVGGKPNQQFSESSARGLLTVGYEHIAEIYIEPRKVSDIALHGLQGLSLIDPGVTVTRIGPQLHVALPDGHLNFDAPPDSDAAAWGALTATMLAVIRQSSPAIGQTEAEQLYKALFDGMLTDLDRFSRYSGPENAKDNRAQREGFGGIGIEIALKEGQVLVNSVVPETPAESIGLRAGDQILAVNGASTANLTERDVVGLLRGPIGLPVDLSIGRAGQSAFAVRVTRAKITVQTVIYRREPGNIAYIRITSFNRQTTATLGRLLQRARLEMGGKLTGIIMDLRNNPGGLLDQGVGVSDLFLRQGRILTTRGRHPDSLQIFEASGQDIAEGAPLILLINGGAASSAEIVAAALQDQGRALVVGTRSYGKGTVQTVLGLPNAGELTLTWARLYAPSGYLLNRIGVLPNLCTADLGTSISQELADLRGGRIDPAAIVAARRGADKLGENEQLAFINQCPTTQRDRVGDTDLELAKALLNEPGLFVRVSRGLQTLEAWRQAKNAVTAAAIPAPN